MARTAKITPFQFPSLPLALFKVDTASVKAGQVLPRSSKSWEGIYVPVLGLIIGADQVDDTSRAHKNAMASAAKATVCGLPARKGAPALSRLEWQLLIRDDLYVPAVDPAFFRFGSNKWEWTSTSCSPSDYAWAVGLDDGFSYRYHQSDDYRVRAVCPSQDLRTSVKGA